MSAAAEASRSLMPLDASPDGLAFAGPYRVTALRSVAAWAPLAAAWDAFLAECGVHHLCLTYTWLTTWLESFPPEALCVLIAQDAHGRWAGVAPLQISRGRQGLCHRLLRHVQWIGAQPDVCDWLTLPVHPRAEEAAVLQALAQALAEVRWDVLALRFNPNPRQWEAWRAVLGGVMREGESMPLVPLPESAEAYEAQRSKKTRARMRTQANRLRKDFPAHAPELVFHDAYSPETAGIWADFVEGHRQYWAGRGVKSDFARYPALSDFYARMLARSAGEAGTHRPQLLFSGLMLNGEALSHQLLFWQGDACLSHITHYNPAFQVYSPGAAHMDHLVFHTLARGGQRFELGRGDEPYKALWATEKTRLWDLVSVRGPLASLLWRADLLLKRLLGKEGE